jgi:cell division septation protein DedD
MTRKLGFVLLLALAFLASAWSQTANPGKKAPTASTTPTAPPASLSSARQALGKKASGTESFAAAIESYALALGPRDAVALIMEFAPKAPESRRRGLYSLSASLAMVLGDYAAAAAALSRSAGGSAEVLLKAFRCSLAAGDFAQAAKTLALVPDIQNSKSYVDPKRLASAWTSLLSGRTEEAFAALKSLAVESEDAETRREALFLLWMIASSSEIDAVGAQAKLWSAAEILAQLREKCPGSMELAAAESRVALKPSSWLLNSVHPQVVAEGERSLADDEPAVRLEPSATSAVELQVGWFSGEDNAKYLAAALKAKGFTVIVDERSTSDKEKRWAVLVVTSGDWTKVQTRLKDLGYESYLAP